MSATATPSTGSSCPICGQPLRPTHVHALDRLATGEGPFTVVECVSCQYGVTVPQLSDEALAHYYPDEYYEVFYEHSGKGGPNALTRLRNLYRRWSSARRFRRPPYVLSGITPGRMLDVGCGAGELLEQYAERGWETYGIDPSSSATAAAARRGAHVHTGTLVDQPWPEDSFQLITFQDALEHIVDPIDALRRARGLLAPGGLVLISVPNWCCWQRRFVFRSRWFSLDLPRHQQHFSVRALQRLAASSGLRVRSVGPLSNVPVPAYSLHYVLFGHLRPGWRLWLSYALGMLAFPLVLVGDRVGGGPSCFIVMERAG
jgi:2-polyprenyl-3-methyl-5-hydroxy-6-metoxy-1,4-benzoquinol methylase